MTPTMPDSTELILYKIETLTQTVIQLNKDMRTIMDKAHLLDEVKPLQDRITANAENINDLKLQVNEMKTQLNTNSHNFRLALIVVSSIIGIVQFLLFITR
jgi:predicted  nucleic acid-binding Zn-ribbon protein